MEHGTRFFRRPLGPLDVSPIGLASSYGIGERDVESAFEGGIDFFFWGALRRHSFGRGVRAISRRGAGVVAIQSFARRPLLIRASLELARRRLGRDVIDLLVLGLWDELPPPALVDVALRARDRGHVRAIGISSHHRGTLALLARDPIWDVLMLRYNAAHTGAEDEVFPHLGAPPKSVLAYTALRWGSLLRGEGLDEPAPSATDCYRFALSHPSVSACLAAPGDTREMQAALRAIELGPLSAEDESRLRRIGAKVHARSRGIAPTTWRDGFAHARGIVDEIRDRGFTEGLVSRFNR